MISREIIRLRFRAWRYRWKQDRHEIQFVRRLLAPGDVAVDIGSHKGAYVYWMHQAVQPGGRVICFEPQPQLADYLGRMKAALRMDEVTVENLAVSSQRGEMTLTVPGGRPSPGSTLEPGLIQGEQTSYRVAVTTLDDYFPASTSVKLVKCDVEGHELEVFRGGEKLLRTQRPSLLFECEERHHKRYSSRDVFAFLEQLGYGGYFFAHGLLRPLREFDTARYGDPASRDYVNNFVFRPRAI
jgi:FkbM family methyltransferase